MVFLFGWFQLLVSIVNIYNAANLEVLIEVLWLLVRKFTFHVLQADGIQEHTFLYTND